MFVVPSSRFLEIKIMMGDRPRNSDSFEDLERRAEQAAFERIARTKAMGALFSDYKERQRGDEDVIQMSTRMYGLEEDAEQAFLPRDLLQAQPDPVEKLDKHLRKLIAASEKGSSNDEVLERYARRSEDLVRKGRCESSAERSLCLCIRDARARLACKAANDEASAVQVRAAWAAHYKRLEGGLSGLKRRKITDASGVLAEAAEATAFFAPLLENFVDAPLTAHALLMALGDLERYGESYGSGAERRADALYLRAMRMKPSSGRAPGMLATLASLRGESAVVVHWARRAIVAPDAWIGARELMLSHGERCKRMANEALSQRKRRSGRSTFNLRSALADCELQVSALAAVCFTRVSGVGGFKASIERHTLAAIAAISGKDDDDKDGPSRQHARHARWARRQCLRVALTSILAVRAVLLDNNEALDVVAVALDSSLKLISAMCELGPAVAVSAVLALLAFFATEVAPDDAPFSSVALDTSSSGAGDAIATFLNSLDDEESGEVLQQQRVVVDDDELCCGVLPSTCPSEVVERLVGQEGPRAQAERVARCLSIAEDLVEFDTVRALISRHVQKRAKPSSRRRRDAVGEEDEEAVSANKRYVAYKRDALTSVFNALEIDEYDSATDDEDTAPDLNDDSSLDEESLSSSSSSSEEEGPRRRRTEGDRRRGDAFSNSRRRSLPKPTPRRKSAAPTSEPAEAGVRLSAMAPLGPVPARMSLAVPFSPATTPSSPEEKLLFVIDAANVAMRFGQKGVFSTRGIAATMDYLSRRFDGRCRFAMFLPEYMLDSEKVAQKRRAHDLGIRQAKFQELPDDVSYLQQLESDSILVATPAQDYDDSYQIEYARRHGGVIVTNDMFRDAVEKLKPHLRGALREWMRAHLLSFTFVGEEFIPNPDFQFPVAVRIAKKE